MHSPRFLPLTFLTCWIYSGGFTVVWSTTDDYQRLPALLPALLPIFRENLMILLSERAHREQLSTS